MLSKRLNDVIFIGIILIVIGAIVGMRFFVLGFFDERIEDIEAENQQLSEQINDKQAIISRHTGEPLPPVSMLYQRVPSHYSSNRLRYTMFTQLELMGISDVPERDLLIQSPITPSFPEGSEFYTLSQSLDARSVTIRFNTDDIDEIYQVIEQIQSMQQRFILQNLHYDHPPEDGTTRANLVFVTFYNTSD